MHGLNEGPYNGVAGDVVPLGPEVAYLKSEVKPRTFLNSHQKSLARKLQRSSQKNLGGVSQIEIRWVTKRRCVSSLISAGGRKLMGLTANNDWAVGRIGGAFPR